MKAILFFAVSFSFGAFAPASDLTAPPSGFGKCTVSEKTRGCYDDRDFECTSWNNECFVLEDGTIDCRPSCVAYRQIDVCRCR